MADGEGARDSAIAGAKVSEFAGTLEPVPAPDIIPYTEQESSYAYRHFSSQQKRPGQPGQ